MVTCHQRVPQGSSLSPVLVNNFINDLEAGLEEALSKFTDGMKLVGAVEVPSKAGRPFLQRDPTKSEGWEIHQPSEIQHGKVLDLTHRMRQTLDFHTDWGMRFWKAVLQKGPRRPRWWKFDYESAVHILHPSKSASYKSTQIKRSFFRYFAEWLHKDVPNVVLMLQSVR